MSRSRLKALVDKYSPNPNHVLELGCGKGFNAALFDAPTVYEGVDTTQRYYPPEGNTKFHLMDFTKELPSGSYDVVIDRAGLTYNTNEAISRTLAMVHERLNPHGIFISVELYKPGNDHEGHPPLILAEPLLHKARGFTQSEIENLFSGFEILELTEYPDEGGSFDIVARKYANP